jgi:osmotically-inducible protein OsmY
MKSRIVLLLLGLATVLTAADAFAQAAAPGLEGAVKQKLVDKLGEDAKAIKVAVVEGKVVMIGEVKGRDTQELATEVAKSVPGVKSIDNQIKTPAEKSVGEGKIKDEVADGKLEAAVESALKNELGAHAKGLEVECTAGTVSVRGTVPDETRRTLARKAVKAVPGVGKVVDLLDVASK